MDIVDTNIQLHLTQEFTSLKPHLSELIQKHELVNATIVCWVPHEVSSLVQIGWEKGLLEDIKDFLNDIVPKGMWINHDEPDTPFRHNFYEHIKTKLVGTVSMTFIVRDATLVLGEFQDIYFYSPVFDRIPNQKIVCRIQTFQNDADEK